MTEQPKLRFAVGIFDSWLRVFEALSDLRARGVVLDSLNCLSLDRVFAGKTVMPPGQEAASVKLLGFADRTASIACTSGPLADCLLRRLASGAASLREALERWLIPRHAAHLEDAVRAGNILLWVRIGDADDERRAYQALLAHSSNSVGVHDLVLPGEQ